MRRPGRAVSSVRDSAGDPERPASCDDIRKEDKVCLAIPSKIVEKEEMTALVDVCGARREVNLMLLPEEVEVGDYVLVHAGFAMQRVDREAAQSSLEFFGNLVEAERSKEGQEEAAGEASDILRRGTIIWDKSPGRER